jgi:hypothetical protein
VLPKHNAWYKMWKTEMKQQPLFFFFFSCSDCWCTYLLTGHGSCTSLGTYLLAHTRWHLVPLGSTSSLAPNETSLSDS